MASKKYQISLSTKISEILEKLSTEKGLAKSVVVALALEKFYKEEENRSNDKK